METHKIIITDKMILTLQNIFDCRRSEAQTALEAVFAHIANQPEKPDSSIWDNFPPESPILDKQDNDGWIESETVKNITLEPHQKIDIKTSNGKVISVGAAGYSWNLKGLVLPWAIIAYRIISESKEEKPDINKLSDQIQSITDQVLEITSMIEAITKVKAEYECKTASVVAVNNMQERICIKCGEKVMQKEPKKQTLLEYCLSVHDIPTLVKMKAMPLLPLISEYLENN